VPRDASAIHLLALLGAMKAAHSNDVVMPHLGGVAAQARPGRRLNRFRAVATQGSPPPRGHRDRRVTTAAQSVDCAFGLPLFLVCSRIPEDSAIIHFTPWVAFGDLEYGRSRPSVNNRLASAPNSGRSQR
jgi:hypothetical protein